MRAPKRYGTPPFDRLSQPSAKERYQPIYPRELTDSAIAKLNGITDAQYAELDLFPDFGD